MNYKNAEHIFPRDFLEEIQKYVDGEIVYIPRKLCNKKQWGQNTETKGYLKKRNKEIICKHKTGINIKELSEQYFLSEKTIYKIIETKSHVFIDD